MADPKRGTLTRTTTPAGRGARSTAVAKIEATFVEFQAPNTSAPEYDPALGDGYTEAPSALTPTALWTRPGEFFEGKYLGLQEQVGPNGSRLYNFETEDAQVVSVWGTVVLDNRLDMCIAQGLKPGDLVKIVYVGDTEAKKGQNPARIFKVGFKRAPAA